MKSGFLDRLIANADRIDPRSLQTHFLRLYQEKGLLETIFQAIQEGIIVLDGHGCISYANRAAEQFMGFSAEAATGNSISQYLKEIDWDRAMELDVEEWSKLISKEIEVQYPKHRYLSFYVVPLATVHSDEGGAVVILRDRTAERENEQTLLQSERLNAVTLLAAGVAHEIGNPLNSLNIHLQLLTREIKQLVEPAHAGQLGELVQVARDEVGRLDVIITQFLRALRPARPELTLHRIEDLVEETLHFMKHEIQSRAIAVEVNRPDHLPRVAVDADQIKQAFFNIIKNAIQAMPDGGQLAITLAHTDTHVHIAFTDSGVGIEANERSRIFEPYHTSKADGTGLGLMIVQRIVQDHDGEIDVASEPGKGATFTIILPRHQRQMRLLEQPAQAVNEPE